FVLLQPGRLVLRTQLDLWQMLQPATQPGSKLDYEPPVEEVEVNFRGPASFRLEAPAGEEAGSESSGPVLTRFFKMRSAADRWARVTVEVPTGAGPSLWLQCDWRTGVQPEVARAFPLRRFLLPWAKSDMSPSPDATRRVPEIAGGHWLRG